MTPTLVLYEFSRSQTERGDFSHFLGAYAPDKLPSGRRLRAMTGRLVFSFAGYDEDPRELHLIPEVRRFCSALHDAWPYWLYFCDLETPTLLAMVASCLPSVMTINVDGRPNVRLQCKAAEMLAFLRRGFVAMNVMCDRARMPDRENDDRSKAVFGYFGLPFDASPP